MRESFIFRDENAHNRKLVDWQKYIAFIVLNALKLMGRHIYIFFCIADYQIFLNNKMHF